MTANDKYTLLNRDSLTQQNQTHLSQKQKTFSQFFSTFLKFYFNFEHFQKKDDPHRLCISEIIDSIKQIRSMSNNSGFRGPFEKQHGKLAQTLLKSERQSLYHIYWSLWRQLSLKKSLLHICKIVRLFVNTLTANDKYYLVNRDILKEPIQIQLPQKLKILLNFFKNFEIYLNFWTFSKKRWPS